MSKLNVKIKKLHPDAEMPKYATRGAAGFDFVAAEKSVIYPGQSVLIKTGLSFEVPEGFELQVRPRSGLSLKTKLRVANSPGTVDSDYRGEVCIIMTNTGQHQMQTASDTTDEDEPIFIEKGDRIAQGVICPVYQAEFDLVEDLSHTYRGAGGFGSTGK